MTFTPIRRAALGAAAVTALGAVATVAPADASPSFPVICASVEVDAPRNQVTTFMLSCADEEGNPVDQYVLLSEPGKADTFTVDSVSGEVSYQPVAGATGTDSFTFKGVVEGLGESAPTSAVITLGNQRPVCAAVPAVSAAHDRATPVVFTCEDGDGDELTVSVGTSGATHGTVATDGGVVYTPVAGYVGPDAFTLRASDGDLLSEEVQVAVTVTNARPVCTGGTFTTVHDRSRALALSCSDADGDGLVRSVVAKAQHGKVTISGGQLTYVPASRYVGTDTFTVAATDGLQSSVPVRFNVTVTNALPTCTGGGSLTARGTRRAAVRITCADRNADRTSVVIVSRPRHGRLVKVGARWYYVANRGYRGRDTFRLAGSDGVGRSRTLSYAVTVRR